VVHLGEGFDFLGFTVRRFPSRRGGKLIIKPSAAAVRRFKRRLATEFRSLRGANAAAVLARIAPVTRGWGAFYRTVVSSRVFSGLDDYLWKLCYKWATWSHPKKPKPWIAGRYFGRFHPGRADRWVFGDRASGAYLPRLAWMKIELETNWKFATDNFSESYHTRTAHPQVPPWIDQDYWSARHEMWPNGHGRTVQPMRPSLRDRLPAGVEHPFDYILRQWDIDPDSYPDFETKAMQGWLDLKKQKRKLWKEKGFLHYEHLNDEELTDSPHTVMFPNVTISFLPDNIIFFRTEPHPDDPNKCTFDLWSMVFPVKGIDVMEAIMVGPRPVKEAEFQHRVFDGGRGIPEMEGQIVYQDMMLAEGQQRGMHSRGYKDSYLAAQEARVRFFHEVLNDYLEGRRK